MITSFLLGALGALNLLMLLAYAGAHRENNRLRQRVRGLEDWRSSQLLLNQSVGHALVVMTRRLPLSASEAAHIETLKARTITPGPKRPQ